MIDFAGGSDVAALLSRTALGGFYFMARFRWVYDPSQEDSEFRWMGAHGDHVNHTTVLGERWFNKDRHASLCNKLGRCGFGRDRRLAALVALTEIVGGAFVVFGLLTQLSALALLVVTLFATVCTAKEKVKKQNPIDDVDCVTCYLWLVEPHLIVLALVVIFLGPGALSLDAWVF